MWVWYESWVYDLCETGFCESASWVVPIGGFGFWFCSCFYLSVKLTIRWIWVCVLEV